MADTKTPSEPPPSYSALIQIDEDNEDSKAAAPASKQPPSIRPRPPFPLDLPALNSLRTTPNRIVLASASPRRLTLLSILLPRPSITVVPSRFPEDLPKSLSPLEYVLQTATKKAMEVYGREVDNVDVDAEEGAGKSGKGELGLVIAADTIVMGHFGEILEKPRSEGEHRAMLRKLRDEGLHKVITAVAVMRPSEGLVEPGYVLETAVEETGVLFDSNVTDSLLDAYVRTREGADKAGGYGIQGMGSVLVERIEGTHDNVVGLPLRATLQLIEKVMMPDDSLGELVETEEDE